LINKLQDDEFEFYEVEININKKIWLIKQLFDSFFEGRLVWLNIENYQ
jgi:hypothetical protein